MSSIVLSIFLLSIGASFIQRTTGFGFGIFIMTMLPFLMPSYDYDKQQTKYDKQMRKLLSDEQYEGYLKLKPQFYSQCRDREFLMGGQPQL